METDEQQAIRQTLQDNSEAYALLVGRYAEGLTAYIRRIVPRCEEAEELVQDAFVRAYQQLSRYDADRAPFRHWLYRIATRLALMHLRRQRLLTVSLDDERQLYGVSDEAADQLLSDVRPDRIALLEEAVRRLSPDEQLLLHLYYTDDRPLRDIAYILDREASYLATRLQRIRKKLYLMIKTAEHEQE